jgi:hypothetical protein
MSTTYKELIPRLDERCAPGKKNKDSCYDLETLQLLATAFNNKNKDNQININKFNDRKYLLSELTNKLKNKCDDQICWLKIGLINNSYAEKIKNNIFRPVGPSKQSDQFKWLSNRDIDNVLNQYEKTCKDFKYLCTVPIDFAKLEDYIFPNNVISNKNYINTLNNLKSMNKTKIAVVFNLDKHTGNGTHWVALYSDLKNKQIYFFDSYAFLPKKEICEFMAKIANYISGNNKYDHIIIKNILEKYETSKNNYDKIKNDTITNYGIDIRHNIMPHQREGSECGVYSISFISRLLNNEPFDNLISERISDIRINKCRQYYFTH